MKRGEFIRYILAPYAGTRVLFYLAGALGQAIVPPAHAVGINHWLAILAYGDSWAYSAIASRGYELGAAGVNTAGFFPVYPALLWAAGRATGLDSEAGRYAAGILLSNGAFLAMLVLLYRLGEELFDASVARISVLVYLVFPVTLFLSSAVPESLCLLLMLGSLTIARRGNWPVACVLAAAAALTNELGLAWAVGLAAFWWERYRQGKVSLLAAWPFAAIPAAFIPFFFHLSARFGSPSVYLEAHRLYGTQVLAPWDSLVHWATGPLVLIGYKHAVTDILTIAGLGLLLIPAWKHLPGHLFVWAAGAFGMLLVAGGYTSSLRHAMLIVPLMLALARMLSRHKATRIFYFSQSVALGLIFSARIASGYWVS